MLVNMLQLAWRNIFRNKVYSFINVAGLALGLTACLVAYFFIYHDLSFDRFHPDKDRIYRIVSQWPENDGRIVTYSILPAAIPESISQKVTGIEKVCGVFPFRAEITVPEGEHPDMKFGSSREGDNVSTVITDPAYFDIFQCTWLALPLILKNHLKL